MIPRYVSFAILLLRKVFPGGKVIGRDADLLPSSSSPKLRIRGARRYSPPGVVLD
jgi:hypothetical protein